MTDEISFKVPNHTSDQHEWFLLSSNRTAGYENYYVWRDCPLGDDGKRILPNNWVINKTLLGVVIDKITF